MGDGPGISNSVAVKFDLWQTGANPSSNCTGLFTNGDAPDGGIDLTPSKNGKGRSSLNPSPKVLRLKAQGAEAEN